MARIRPVFPDMPTQGLFRVIRQPIYVAFALTLWTVPVWTPDQLVLAVSYTAYCLLAPRCKERRFEALYGARFKEYCDAVPYAAPKLKKGRRADSREVYKNPGSSSLGFQFIRNIRSGLDAAFAWRARQARSDAAPNACDSHAGRQAASSNGRVARS
jgi:hypothetical protein